MAQFTGLLAQCITVGDVNARNAQGSPVPTSQICGPFPTIGPNNTCPTGNCFSTPGDVISRVMQFAFPLAGVIVFFVFLSAGYDFIMSKGDPSKLQAASKKITSALIGFGLLLISYLVVKTLSIILGFTSPI